MVSLSGSHFKPLPTYTFHSLPSHGMTPRHQPALTPTRPRPSRFAAWRGPDPTLLPHPAERPDAGQPGWRRALRPVPPLLPGAAGARFGTPVAAPSLGRSQPARPADCQRAAGRGAAAALAHRSRRSGGCTPEPGATASRRLAQGSTYASARLLPESARYSVAPTMVRLFGLPSTPAAFIPSLKGGRYSSARWLAKSARYRSPARSKAIPPGPQSVFAA